MRRPIAKRKGLENRKPSTSWASRSCAANHAEETSCSSGKPGVIAQWPSSRNGRTNCVGECICPSPGKGCGCGRASPASMVTMQCRPTSRHLRPSGSMSPDSGGARFDGAVKRTARSGHGSRSGLTTSFPKPASVVLAQASALPSNTQGGSRMRESRTYGSVRGACSNGRPYRDPRYRSNPLELRATEIQPRSSLNDLAGNSGDQWLAAHRAALELDWLDLSPAQGFAPLPALRPEEKERLFAWCIAARLKPQLAIEHRADPVIEAAGQRLRIGFEDYWRPTAANYWSRAKKAHGLAIGREILGDRWARDHADDKKPVLAAALETAFDIQLNTACIGLEQAARDSAAAWLPPGIACSDDDASA